MNSKQNYNDIDELLKRGVPLGRAMMLGEAIASAKLSGAKSPRTSKEWDYLVERMNQMELLRQL